MIVAFIAGTISFSLGLFVYLKNPKKPVNIFFGLMAFSTAVWNFSDLAGFVENPRMALLLVRAFYIAGIFLPAFSVHFVVSIVRYVIGKDWKKVFVVTYGNAFILLCLVFTPLVIKGVNMDPFKEIPGILYPFFITFFAGCFLYVLYILIIGFRKSTGLKRMQITYVFLAYAIGLVAALVYFIGFSWVNFPQLTYVIEIGYTLAITYAIIKYRLMDIKAVISRAGVFAIVYGLVLGVPFYIGSLFKEHFSETGSSWWLLPVGLMALLSSIGPFIYIKLQRRFEARLRAQEFKSHEALRRLSHNMLRFTNLNVLLKLMVHYLVKVLKLKFAAIYLIDTQNEKYLLSSSWQSEESVKLLQEFEAGDYLIEYLNIKRLPVVTEELSLYAPAVPTFQTNRLFSTLSELKINTVIPCFLRTGLLGFLILSDRKNNIHFTQDDLNLLMLLSNEAALAIENAQFHQKEVSQLLEKSKREALADMAPGASHQFNNRLASISSSVELLLFKMENAGIDSFQDEKAKVLLKDIREALELIDGEVYKGKEITAAILKRAKAKVEFQEFSLANLIENAYKLVMISRSRSGLDKARVIKFNLVSSEGLPNIFASEALLQDVFYNLIDNAYDAIQDKANTLNQANPLYEGEIEVLLGQEDHVIVARVRDNGIGLTKENCRKLFTPYFTTKATSNKGSGLGLCVIRDFIEVHKGSISCDSEYGKGAVFTIKLPIRKDPSSLNTKRV